MRLPPGRRCAFERGEFLHHATKGKVKFRVAVMVADENVVSADELPVARLRLAEGNNPIFRWRKFVT